MRIDTSSPNYKWIVLAAAAMGVYSTVIDMGIVNIALPTITAHFDASLTAVQWIVLIYLVIISAILLPIGSASDRFGRKRLYVIGFLLLSGGAALAAAAPSLPWLFGARAIQAVGAASVQGLSMAIAVAVFPPQERGRALGLMATVVALGAVTGPPIGGVLVDAFGWRAVFLVNTALAPLGALFALVALKDAAIGTPSAQGGKTDWAGAVTSSTALVSVLLVFSRGSEVGWTSPFVLAFAAIAVVSLALFIAAELRAEHPMIDLALFRRSAFTLGGIAGWLVFASASAYVMVTPFYLQGVLEYRPREAALIMTPTAFVLAVTGPIAGRLSDKLEALGRGFRRRPAPSSSPRASWASRSRGRRRRSTSSVSRQPALASAWASSSRRTTARCSVPSRPAAMAWPPPSSPWCGTWGRLPGWCWRRRSSRWESAPLAWSPTSGRCATPTLPPTPPLLRASWTACA